MTRKPIAQLARKYTEYDMITRHTDLPEFPEGRVRLLQAVLADLQELGGQAELYPLATSLVQLGLDTHDLVENEESGAKAQTKQMRARQMKVLAGDYFSGRFYHLLSQAGQIETVKRLSEAVCEVNRIKMSLYGKMKQMRINAEEYVSYGSAIRGVLFMSFGHLMSGMYAKLWPELVERFSRCELLLQELLRLQRPDELSGSWGVWHVMGEGSAEDRRALEERADDHGLLRQLMDKYGVADKLVALLRQSAGQLQAMLPKLPSDKLAAELASLIEPFLHGPAWVPAAAIKELG
ncbi:heptaprenyl diphosphate synthase [Cohnella sp. OV330]|uniref:heptaprenyl diphosphate synthase component 1 n=1 Tax=Cohnella sp. OV330 TaxID=1855288 RepID=UPI0008F1B707|nr:heptaprenyl diphosphate synthase component 1 [Cohnella sp. OV330]SFB18306.1 heptaprenyl diphosphate synthase [Cohnella sp. OV330]